MVATFHDEQVPFERVWLANLLYGAFVMSRKRERRLENVVSSTSWSQQLSWQRECERISSLDSNGDR